MQVKEFNEKIHNILSSLQFMSKTCRFCAQSETDNLDSQICLMKSCSRVNFKELKTAAKRIERLLDFSSALCQSKRLTILGMTIYCTRIFMGCSDDIPGETTSKIISCQERIFNHHAYSWRREMLGLTRGRKTKRWSRGAYAALCIGFIAATYKYTCEMCGFDDIMPQCRRCGLDHKSNRQQLAYIVGKFDSILFQPDGTWSLSNFQNPLKIDVPRFVPPIA